MTPQEIKAAIKAKGFTQKSLAEKIGKSEMTLSMTVNKKMVSDYVMRSIADVIGKTPRKRCFPSITWPRPKRGTSKNRTTLPARRAGAAIKLYKNKNKRRVMSKKAAKNQTANS